MDVIARGDIDVSDDDDDDDDGESNDTDVLVLVVFVVVLLAVVVVLVLAVVLAVVSTTTFLGLILHNEIVFVQHDKLRRNDNGDEVGRDDVRCKCTFVHASEKNES